MTKYIDADRLKADLDKWAEAIAGAEGDYSDGVRFAIQHFIFLVASLQQGQVVMSDTDKSNLRDVPAIIRASNHPFKENLALTFEKYIK